MPFVTAPLITMPSGLDALLGRVNVSLMGIQQKLAQQVAQFFATPVKVREFATRIAYVQRVAQSRGNTDAMGKLAGLQAQVNQLSEEYLKAKPAVIDALGKVDAAQASGQSVLSSGVISAVAKAGVQMAGVFGMTSGQDAAIKALENGTLTPKEAVDLYGQLQNPNATRNLVFAGGAVVLVWLLLRRG